MFSQSLPQVWIKQWHFGHEMRLPVGIAALVEAEQSAGVGPTWKFPIPPGRLENPFWLLLLFLEKLLFIGYGLSVVSESLVAASLMF